MATSVQRQVLRQPAEFHRRGGGRRLFVFFGLFQLGCIGLPRRGPRPSVLRCDQQKPRRERLLAA
jgi:hypothetical protein